MAKMAYAKPKRTMAMAKQTGKQQKVTRTMAAGLPKGKGGWKESQKGKPMAARSAGRAAMRKAAKGKMHGGAR